MLRKASLKKINDILQWIVSIAMIVMGIYYFFISKDIFRGRQFLIMWGCIFTLNAARIIDSRYFKGNLSWKNNWANIIQVSLSIIIFATEILWF